MSPGLHQLQLRTIFRVFRVSVVNCCLFSAALPVAAQRQRLSMDPGWRFTLGDPAEAQQPSFDDSRWRMLDLPHDWSIEGIPQKGCSHGCARRV